MFMFIQHSAAYYRSSAELLTVLQTLALLASRFYVGWVFFAAGLTKINDWETTLWLFEEDYSVPFLPFELAAVLGNGGELILPILLFIGLATRFSALGLRIVNIVAVLSLKDIEPAAFTPHVLWGTLLAQ